MQLKRSHKILFSTLTWLVSYLQRHSKVLMFCLPMADQFGQFRAAPMFLNTSINRLSQNACFWSIQPYTCPLDSNACRLKDFTF